MRTVLWTVFLVVALQGIASASVAFGSPVAGHAAAQVDAVSGTESGASRLNVHEDRAQASLRASERKPARSDAQVLSKNFPRPKPVQIYWFFGGR